MLVSPAKLVFVMLALTACLAFLVEVGLGRIIFDTKDFMNLAVAAFAFFFAYKGNADPDHAGK